MKFDRKKFFDGYRQAWGGLRSQQVDGLNFILDAAELDPYLKHVEWLGYELGTTKHETADTFQPIHEYGGHNYFVKRYGGQTALGRRLGNDTPEEGADYSGEGDVQLTGESNYEKAEAALRAQYPELVAAFEARTGRKFDLTVGDQPNDKDDTKNAGDPAIAYAIMSYGMRTGMFTGKKLADYISPPKIDYTNARRIINGLDKAALIAGYATKFTQILKAAALEQSAVAIPTAAKPTDAPPAVQPPPTLPTSDAVNAALIDPNVAQDEVHVVPQVSVEPTADTKTGGIRGSIAAAVAFITSLGSGFVGMFSGLAPVFIISFFGAATAVGIVFIVMKMRNDNKQKERDDANREADKKRAHEVQMALINSAADKNKNTVRVAPPPVEMPNGAPAQVAPANV